jgi:hypothetical protein
VNRTHPLLRDCGIHTKLAVKALQSAADTLSDLMNVNPLIAQLEEPTEDAPGHAQEARRSVREAERTWRLWLRAQMLFFFSSASSMW